MAEARPRSGPFEETWAEKEALARRHAPVLVLWPEIPASSTATPSLREAYSRPTVRWASRPTGAAHTIRDFHPCDVRQILDHAQVWEPTPPLPLVPRWFPRSYRDMARFFFWPLTALVVAALLLLALAQGLPPAAGRPVELGILVVLGALYLVMVRSPILVPIDSWHHLNHAVVGLGLVAAWGAAFGTRQLWVLGPIIAIPTLLAFLTGVAMRVVRGLTNVVLDLLQRARDAFLRSRAAARSEHPGGEPHTSRLFHGLKAAHEYSGEAELFYRDPSTQKPIHRADQAGHWAAWARIQAETPRASVCYARVLDPDEDGVRAIQYWFCYYYNDWANVHEGDWESTVVLLRDGQPVAAAASQHERGEYRECRHLQWREGRPVLYVAVGSHAMYFEEGAYLAERSVAGLQVTALDATLLGRNVLDFVDFTATGAHQAAVLEGLDVVLVPDPDEASGRWGHLAHDAACPGGCRHDFEWLNFRGHWGAAAAALSFGTSGPRGPAFAGLRWDSPRLWARTMCRPCRVCEDDRPI